MENSTPFVRKQKLRTNQSEETPCKAQYLAASLADTPGLFVYYRSAELSQLKSPGIYRSFMPSQLISGLANRVAVFTAKIHNRLPVPV
jgi:hypothetical protein